MSETSNNNYDNKNEIDFFELLFTIFKGKLIIFIITSLFALVGFMYLSNLPVKPYQASVSFISPSASSIAECCCLSQHQNLDCLTLVLCCFIEHRYQTNNMANRKIDDALFKQYRIVKQTGDFAKLKV